jgi:hypothetical protein
MSGNLTVDTNTLFVDSANNRVGVGTVSPAEKVDIAGNDANAVSLQIVNSETASASVLLGQAGSSGYGVTSWGSSVGILDGTNGLAIGSADPSAPLLFYTSNTRTERARIDSSGNLLVGTTGATLPESGTTSAHVGVSLDASNYVASARYQNIAGYFNRIGNDGDIISFRKDGSTVGSISAWSSGLLVGTGDVGLAFVDGTPERIQPRKADDQTSADGLIDLGHSSNRFKDLYLSGGVYLGGTAAANKLDSYEEGAWTPSLEGSTGALTSITYVSRDGHYRKIGDTVIVWWDIQQTNISGGSGAIQIPLSDLPFTPSFSLNGGREIASGAAQTFLVPWPHDGTIGTRFEPSEGIQFQISRNNGTWSTITTANASGAGKYWGGHLIYRTTAT